MHVPHYVIGIAIALLLSAAITIAYLIGRNSANPNATALSEYIEKDPPHHKVTTPVPEEPEDHDEHGRSAHDDAENFDHFLEKYPDLHPIPDYDHRMSYSNTSRQKQTYAAFRKDLEVQIEKNPSWQFHLEMAQLLAHTLNYSESHSVNHSLEMEAIHEACKYAIHSGEVARRDLVIELQHALQKKTALARLTTDSGPRKVIEKIVFLLKDDSEFGTEEKEEAVIHEIEEAIDALTKNAGDHDHG